MEPSRTHSTAIDHLPVSPWALSAAAGVSLSTIPTQFSKILSHLPTFKVLVANDHQGEHPFTRREREEREENNQDSGSLVPSDPTLSSVELNSQWKSSAVAQWLLFAALVGDEDEASRVVPKILRPSLFPTPRKAVLKRCQRRDCEAFLFHQNPQEKSGKHKKGDLWLRK